MVLNAVGEEKDVEENADQSTKIGDLVIMLIKMKQQMNKL
jgi:hypothetical protein